jgi:RNA polymerase sporulation-specific sigma factor
MKNFDMLLRLKLILVKMALKSSGIYYINGSDNLPPPLSQEEESDAFRRLANNDDTARKTLIEHNIRLVVYIAKKFENTGIDVEDLVSIGTGGLIKAVDTFSIEKNIKLATYASRCIENEIRMFLRKATTYRGNISLDDPINIDCDGNELTIGDVLGTENDEVNGPLEAEAEKDMLRLSVNSLGEREKMIMQMRFGLLTGIEMTQKEVADVLHISQSYISRLEKKIIKKLRTDLEML